MFMLNVCVDLSHVYVKCVCGFEPLYVKCVWI